MAEVKGLKTIRCDAPGCNYKESFFPKHDFWSRYSGKILDGSCGENAEWHACKVEHITAAATTALDDKYRNEP